VKTYGLRQSALTNLYFTPSTVPDKSFFLLYQWPMPLEGKVDISDLFPDLDPEQLEEARVNLKRYLGVIFRISERYTKQMTTDF